MKMNRSPRFLYLTLALAAACALAISTSTLAALDRSYVSGNFTISLDGKSCGFLKSVDGGGITAEVIQEPTGPDYFVKKHIGQPKYEDYTIQLGFSMTKEMYQWITASWGMSYERKNGSVTACDYALNVKSQRNFFNALITETTIPACDGSSKEPAYMTLKLSPEYTRFEDHPTGTVKPDYKVEQKMWLPCNFRLSIDGLDCTRVNKIDSFTVKQTVVTDDIGDARDYAKEPGKLEFPNLRITMAEVSAQSWKDWHKAFVIDGNNDEGFEKDGTLVFLSPNRMTQLARITFHNLGIYRLEPNKAEANADTIKRVTAELYCERMEFEYLNTLVTDSGAANVAPDAGDTSADNSVSDTSATDTSAPSDTSTITPPTGLRVETVKPDLALRKMPIAGLRSPLDSSLTGTHNFGGEGGLEFAMTGLDFTVTRETAGEEAVYLPPGKSKLMLVHYTMRNIGDTDKNVDSNTLKFVATDSTGVNHQFTGVNVGAEKQHLNTTLQPGQALDCCVIIALPGRVDAKTLTVTAYNDKTPMQYDVAGKISLIEPYARDASAGANSKFTALYEVPMTKGEYYPMMQYDCRLDSVEYGSMPAIGMRPAENTRCLVVNFTARNALPFGINYDSNTFKPSVAMSDGTTVSWNRRLLSSKVDEAISGPIGANSEMSMRVFFEVPARGEVTPVSLKISEGDSRVYVLPIE
jgi:phage tail-like protein